MKKVTYIILIMMMTTHTLAKEASEPLYDQLKENFKTPYFSIGSLLQVVTDFQKNRISGGEDGFSIANMRVSFGGKLDEDVGYFFQTNFIGSPAILDAAMWYQANTNVVPKIGIFKVPFSQEFIEDARNIDFVNRSQVVTLLVPNRQVGFQLAGLKINDRFGYALGIFNGNQYQNNGNDNGQFLYAARATFEPPIKKGDLFLFGINAAYSKDQNIAIGELFPNFAGHRTLLGGDVRLRLGPWLWTGEGILAMLDQDGGSFHRIGGFQSSLGYFIQPKIQILGRWDSLYKDNLASDSHLAIVGMNIWPTKISEIQINYIIPTSDAEFSNHQLLISTQVGF